MKFSSSKEKKNQLYVGRGQGRGRGRREDHITTYIVLSLPGFEFERKIAIKSWQVSDD